LVVKYNSICKSSELAIAEYPKLKGAVDLSLIKNNGIENKIEFKYQYPKDLKNSSVINALLKDTNTPKGTGHCTNFILIIHERSEEFNSFSKAGVSPIFTNLNDRFTESYSKLLEFENKINRNFKKEFITVKCLEPYPNKYHFVIYHFI